MFKIDRSANSIARLDIRTFSELGFSERGHLQEWLAKDPDVLGEPLLIIQKEFAGFGGTNDRLDLLALDLSGNLVVIENKLDDSGKDVVWQTIKYASYCSTLTKNQIIDIYQKYLGEKQSALEEMQSFFETESIDDIVLNSRNKQRLMMVAAKFRKEVTSTALWLLGFGIDVQCIKITPYSLDEQLFLSIDRIIPTPESKDHMVVMAAKEAEDKASELGRDHRYNIRRRFWKFTLEEFKNSECNLFDNISAGKSYWQNAGSGLANVAYGLIYTKSNAKVELSLNSSIADKNKLVYDKLLKKKDQIEADFGFSLRWLRLDDKSSSRIEFETPFESFDEAN